MDGQGQGSSDFNLTRVDRWGYALGGAALAVWGLGMRRAPVARLALAALGGSLVYQAFTGNNPLFKALGIRVREHRAAGQTLETIEVTDRVTINRPRDEVYRFWRDLENLPRFMSHLESVRSQNGKSHWTAKAPGGASVEWDAEIVEEEPGSLLRWRSLPDSEITNFGSVQFADAPTGNGTEVNVRLEYVPPAGSLGTAVARLIGEEPQRQVEEDLRRLKELMESGAAGPGGPGAPHQPIGGGSL